MKRALALPSISMAEEGRLRSGVKARGTGSGGGGRRKGWLACGVKRLGDDRRGARRREKENLLSAALAAESEEAALLRLAAA